MNVLEAVRHRVTSAEELDTRITEWFRAHPDPSDPEVHDFAREIGVTPEHLERHVYRMFTDCLSAVTSRVAPGGKLELAFMYVVPLENTPPPAMASIVNKLAARYKFKPFFVISSDLHGTYVFEAHSRDPENLRNRVARLLPKAGWQVRPGRTPELLIVSQGSMSFHFMFLNEG